MIPTLTDLILGMCCSLVFTTIHTAVKNRKERRNRESRERQAKLEAFWKEEQLRLNPPPKRISQPPGYIGHNYAIRLTSPNGKTFRLFWSNDAPEDAIIIPDNEPPQLSK